jgi:AraC-like DNA-binding protein
MNSTAVNPDPLHKLIWGTFFGSFESNTDYRLLLLRYCKSGLIICGILGIGVTIAYTFAKLHVNDYMAAWVYTADHYKGVVVLIDKSIIIFFSILVIGMSQISLSLRTCRSLFAVIALICGLASMYDDIMNRDINFSSGYIILILLVTTICIPFKPWQIMALCVTLSVFYYPGMLIFPPLLGVGELVIPVSQLIHFLVLTLILTGISCFLYYMRYALYMARRTADGLAENSYYPEETELQRNETDRLRRIIMGNMPAGDQFLVSDITVPSTDQVFLDRVREVIEQHIGDSNFGVEWLAHEMALSPRQLQRRLKASTGLSAGGLIRVMRLQRAAQLLQQRAGNVSEVAYRVGFQDPAYFSRLFRQMFEVSPSDYSSGKAV